MTMQRSLISRRLLSSIVKPELIRAQQITAHSNALKINRTSIRHASNDTPSSQPIVLEKPDKFRPPSHSQRLARPRQKAYNQESTPHEQEAQKTRRYPHMFPNEGTFMHWFLTNRFIHVWITMGTLCTLAFISITQTFLKTSPYAHLMPSISTLPLHPINYFSETLAVLRLHMEYNTAKTAESRREKILDAQKRRLYRRAHGMENLDAEEDQGIDVRGLVPWDDGLTNKERERGGRSLPMTGRMVVESGGQVGEDIDEFAHRKEHGDGGEVGAEQTQKRKRKLWLGIW